MGHLLRNLRIRQKLWIIIVVAVIGMMLLGGQAINELYQNLLDDRQIKTRHVVETTYNIIRYFGDQAESGAMAKEQAQKLAIEVVKGLRYEEKEYFWINDMHPTMVMHPYKSKLDGQDLSGFEDPNGKRLFVAFVDEVKRNGAGFVDYLWSKPGHDKPVPKISYVKGYAPWGWIIGSGIYLDDVNAIFWSHVGELIGTGMVILLIMASISYALVKAITAPLSRLQAVITNVESTGELNQRTKIAQQDEVGIIATAFDSMLAKLQGLVSDVKQATDLVAGSADKIGTITDRINQRVSKEQTQTDQVATAMNEMAATVQEVSRNAAEAAQSAQAADQETNTGKQVVNATMGSIDNLAREVERAAEVIHKLEEDTESIGKVLDVIQGIAEQTNLLALNAAIEAARAGEQGRGFAVVADEVRTLAQRTQESTQEIQQMIETLQSGAKNAVQVMESGRTRANSSVDKAAKAGASLETITQAVARISDMNTQIAGASEEQGAVVEEILRNVVTISEGAQRTAQDAQQTAISGHELRELSGRLETRINQFRS